MNKEQRLERIQQDTQDPGDVVYVLRGSKYRKKAYHDDPECYQIKSRGPQKTYSRGEAQDIGYFPCRECVLPGDGRRDVNMRRTSWRSKVESDLDLSEVREMSLEELVERVNAAGGEG